MPKLTPFLWFNSNLSEATDFYTSIFPEATVDSKHVGPDGSVMFCTFTILGQQFMGLNGGPQFAFTEAVSIFVSVKDQAEVDEYWEKLQEGGGKPMDCGWLKDRFGLCWQVIPEALQRLMSGGEPERIERVRNAMMKMTKIVVSELEAAHKGDEETKKE
ncbi:Glyoxalase/Bleomycin resistance protein/Dihydroxybiphenyl dioxygenase [Geopyxis carbonaria]|nr:Glyoxalase/Bleomycin resistance protein/Dihydroxybiphenyl dioxygenase [Geopyxis carbonaria]